MKKYIAVALLICGFASVKAQTTRDVGTFHSVEVTDKIQVELIHSSKAKVEIEGENNEHVDVVNKNGYLRLKMNTLNMLKGDLVSIKVYYTDINELSAKKGAKLVTNPEESLKMDVLKLSVGEGALATMNLAVQNLTLKATAGAQVQLAGTANRQDVILNLGASYNGKSLVTSLTNIALNGGGSASVHANGTVDAKTRGGGIIEVYGNPAARTEKKFVGGEIIFK
ncbi:DUF2807 domain-containing protein [Sphingobacteriaceae bacterium WQ 2009]|uniref:DUF2807 domain-containing protein n=1 Tax=Rhinopithecimicrobium faecis TaxID=2820698 RepID=A0A8T4HDZ0_9SPHI|nr:DUF2807 domain-containing protein [Sphingobacteriaceae bacterium WQ 2009]